MKLSKYLLPVLKETPTEAEIISTKEAEEIFKEHHKSHNHQQNKETNKSKKTVKISKKPSLFRKKYMINQIITETNVVIRNFLNICGLLGAPGSTTPAVWPMIWHIGAALTVLGGSWFWFFLRVDVYSEAQPWFRVIKADLFVLALIASSLFGLIWSYLQSLNLVGRYDDMVFLALFIIANLVLFGGVYWSKFAHMFYKPGAAIQKNLAEADGSRDNLPPEADAPEQFGLGIKREEPKHY